MRIDKGKIGLLFQGLIAIALLFLFLREPKQVYRADSPRVINKRITGKEKTIERHFKTIEFDKQTIKLMNLQLNDLKNELQKVKNDRDTFNIVQIQDTMIHVLFMQGMVKDSIIASQDTIITAQRYIINSKDTIITSLEFDKKRFKRQRNWSLIANGILTGFLILK